MAGGLCCRLADAGLSGCRRGKEGGPPPGLVVLSVVAREAGRWSAGDDWAAAIRRRYAAVIRRYLISY